MERSSLVDLVLPTAWTGLSDEQLNAVCQWVSQDTFTADDVKALLIANFCLSPTERENISAADLLPAIEMLDWLDNPPNRPVRVETLNGITAVDRELHGVTFEDYLILENCFQGWVSSQKTEPLQDMAEILYPTEKERESLTPAQCYGIALWWIGLKAMFSQMFPDLFKPTADTEGAEKPNMMEAMNAQIRALTGGDITKEETVLAADCWRALTELNAKAKEAQEMNERLKK